MKQSSEALRTLQQQVMVRRQLLETGKVRIAAPHGERRSKNVNSKPRKEFK